MGVKSAIQLKFKLVNLEVRVTKPSTNVCSTKYDNFLVKKAKLFQVIGQSICNLMDTGRQL